MTIGEKFRLIRTSYGKSQTEFAEDLNLSRQQISAIERDCSKPSAPIISLLCIKYDIDTDWLMDEKNNDKSKVFSKNGNTVEYVISLLNQLDPKRQKMVADIIKVLLNSSG